MVPRRTALALVLAIGSIVMLVSADGVVHATTFNPLFSSPVSFSDTTPGGHPDIGIGFAIPPPHALGGAVNFSDPAMTTATDAQVPTGAYMGRVSSSAQLGLFNDGCNTQVPATFDLVDASTPATTSVTLSGAAGNLAEDDGDFDEDGIVDQPAFANNGIPDGADAYPAFLVELLDPDGAGPAAAIAPVARYFGSDIVFGLSVIPLQVLIFTPGDLAAFPNQGWMTAAWGAPSLIVLGNPLEPPSNAGITDFCNLASNSTILGITHDNACTPPLGAPTGCTQTGAGFTIRKTVDAGCPGNTTPNECGFVRATNPATTKTLKSRVYAVSERDYDGDGIENSLDVCATEPNPAWNPRANNITSGGDSDGDGLPDGCDPNPVFSNSDEDLDGWQNRIDNCPTTPNAGQEDEDVARGVPVPDSGPRTDGIGDVCDIAANNCSDPFPACGMLTPTGANGHYHAVMIADNICIGLAGSDSDGDGVCDVDEPPAAKCAGGVNDNDCDNDAVTDRFDNCIAGPNSPAPFSGPSGQDALTQPAPAGANSVTVGSTAGFVVGNQIVIGAGATRETLRYVTGVTATEIQFADRPGNDQSLAFAHAAGENVAMVAFAQGQRDLNADGFADGTDITILAGSFGKLGGDPSRPAGYQGRFDLNNTGSGPDSVNDGTDITLESGSFGRPC